MDAFIAEKMVQRRQRSDVEEQLYAKVTELDAKVTELTEKMAACNTKGVELTAAAEYYRKFWEVSINEAKKLQALGELKLQRCMEEKRQVNRDRITAEIADEDCKKKLQKANTQGSGGGRKKRRSRRRKKTRKSTKRRSKKSKRR